MKFRLFPGTARTAVGTAGIIGAGQAMQGLPNDTVEMTPNEGDRGRQPEAGGKWSSEAAEVHPKKCQGA